MPCKYSAKWHKSMSSHIIGSRALRPGRHGVWFEALVLLPPVQKYVVIPQYIQNLELNHHLSLLSGCCTSCKQPTTQGRQGFPFMLFPRLTYYYHSWILILHYLINDNTIIFALYLFITVVLFADGRVKKRKILMYHYTKLNNFLF